MKKLQQALHAQAPCRVDLAGGTVDIWPLYLFHPGALTVNFAVDIQTHCRIAPMRGKSIYLVSHDTRREERFPDLKALCRARVYRHPLAAHLVRFFAPSRGLRLETSSESPAGAGISGSSALMIATSAALARFTGRAYGKEELRVLAQDVEARLIRVPTGCQDYYPALYGGVSAIELEPGGVERHAINVTASEIESRFLLVYTGAPRRSGINNWEVFQAHIRGDRRVWRNFDAIVKLAQEMRGALAGRKWGEVAGLLREEWKLRKTNAPGITTPLIEELVAAAARHGARAAKVCGAGGGGCIIIMTDPDGRERVAQALLHAGARLLPLRVSRRGLVLRTVA